MGGAMAQQQKQQQGDAAARSLIDESQGLPPLGPVTSPSMQSATNAYNAGGMQEFDLRQKMGQLQGQKPGDVMAALRLMYQGKSDARAENAVTTAQANRDWDQVHDKDKELYAASVAYSSNSAEALKKLQEASVNNDRASYDIYANQLKGLNDLHVSRKLTTPMQQIPAFGEQGGGKGTYGGKAGTEIATNLEAAQAAAQGKPATYNTYFGMGAPAPTAEASALQQAQAAAQGQTGGTMADYRQIAPPPDYFQNLREQAQAPQGGGGGGASAIPIPPEKRNLPDGSPVGKDASGRVYIKRGNFAVPSR
jgi:hypothetical protein